MMKEAAHFSGVFLLVERNRLWFVGISLNAGEVVGLIGLLLGLNG